MRKEYLAVFAMCWMLACDDPDEAAVNDSGLMLDASQEADTGGDNLDGGLGEGDGGGSDVSLPTSFQSAFVHKQRPEWTIVRWSPRINTLISAENKVYAATSSELILSTTDLVNWDGHVGPFTQGQPLVDPQGRLLLWAPHLATTSTLEPSGVWSSSVLASGAVDQLSQGVAFLGRRHDSFIAQMQSRTFVAKGAQGEWQPFIIPSVTNRVVSMATIGDSSVMVGEGGLVVSTTNGIVWKRSESDLSQHQFSSVAAVPKVGFVAATGQGRLLLSGTGQGWVEVFSQPSVEFNEVAAKEGRIVAVGRLSGASNKARAILVTSSDGQTWRTLEYKKGDSFNSVIVHGNRFVVATNFSLLTSTDGVRWQEGKAIAPAATPRIAFSAGRFVIAGAKGALQSSTDGLLWEPVPLDANADWNAIVAKAEGGFVLAGDNGLRESSDGITWSAIATVPAIGFTEIVRRHNPAAGWLGRGTDRRLYQSPNLRDWSLLPKSAVGPGIDMVPSGALVPLDVPWRIVATPRGFLAYSPTLLQSSVDGRVWNALPVSSVSCDPVGAGDEWLVPTTYGLERLVWSVATSKWETKGKVLVNIGAVQAVAKTVHGYLVITPKELIFSSDGLDVLARSPSPNLTIHAANVATNAERLVLVGEDGLILTRNSIINAGQ